MGAGPLETPTAQAVRSTERWPAAERPLLPKGRYRRKAVTAARPLPPQGRYRRKAVTGASRFLPPSREPAREVPQGDTELRTAHDSHLVPTAKRLRREANPRSESRSPVSV